MYSVHFFYPASFTFYTSTSTGSRTITTYPGDMAVAGWEIRENRTPGVRGTFGWRKITVRAVAPEEAEVLLVRIVSKNNQGKVWFDDVKLKGREVIDLPAPLVQNPSFEIDHSGYNCGFQGGAEVVEGEAHSGRRSLLISRTNKSIVQSSSIAVDSREYELSAWVKADNATGDNYIAISWHRRRVVARLNKAVLQSKLNYALAFKKRRNTPIFVGEFTVHANPSLNSMVNYLKDVLDILTENKLHWCYWSYYSHLPGIGVYSGNPPRITRPEVVDLLKEYLA